MKFAGVYEEKTEEEKKFYLRLVPTSRGVVVLIACDDSGKRLSSGSLLEISLAGIDRVSWVDPDFGFELDEDGRIKEI